MYGVYLFLVEGVLGYLVQCGGCIIGICAIAKKQVKWWPLIITSSAFSIVIYIVRELGMFNFGVHTMIMLLIVNLMCVLILKIEVSSSILGSLIITALVLATEVIDYGILMLFYSPSEITANMAQPMFKYLSAMPGNAVFIIIVVILYISRSVKARKSIIK